RAPHRLAAESGRTRVLELQERPDGRRGPAGHELRDGTRGASRVCRAGPVRGPARTLSPAVSPPAAPRPDLRGQPRLAAPVRPLDLSIPRRRPRLRAVDARCPCQRGTGAPLLAPRSGAQPGRGGDTRGGPRPAGVAPPG